MSFATQNPLPSGTYWITNIPQTCAVSINNGSSNKFVQPTTTQTNLSERWEITMLSGSPPRWSISQNTPSRGKQFAAPKSSPTTTKTLIGQALQADWIIGQSPTNPTAYRISYENLSGTVQTEYQWKLSDSKTKTNVQAVKSRSPPVFEWRFSITAPPPPGSTGSTTAPPPPSSSGTTAPPPPSSSGTTALPPRTGSTTASATWQHWHRPPTGSTGLSGSGDNDGAVIGEVIRIVGVGGGVRVFWQAGDGSIHTKGWYPDGTPWPGKLLVPAECVRKPTPLAALCWGGVSGFKQIRLYFVDRWDVLQEVLRSTGGSWDDGFWRVGMLGSLKRRVSRQSRLVAKQIGFLRVSVSYTSMRGVKFAASISMEMKIKMLQREVAYLNHTVVMAELLQLLLD